MGGAQASKTVLRITVLRIYCKFSLMYLRIGSAVAGTTITKKLAFGSLGSWLDNLSSDLEDGKELKKTTERRSPLERIADSD